MSADWGVKADTGSTAESQNLWLPGCRTIVIQYYQDVQNDSYWGFSSSKMLQQFWQVVSWPLPQVCITAKHMSHISGHPSLYQSITGRGCLWRKGHDSSAAQPRAGTSSAIHSSSSASLPHHKIFGTFSNILTPKDKEVKDKGIGTMLEGGSSMPTNAPGSLGDEMSAGP